MLVLYPIRVIPKLQTTRNKKVIVVAILGCRLLYVSISLSSMIRRANLLSLVTLD